MEEALLKEMVVERDKKIAQLETAVEDHECKLATIQMELEQVREQSSQSKLEYRRAIAALVQKRDEGLHKIQKIEKDVRNQNGSLHIYADILKEAAPESVDSSYVVRMQSQLCKAMHSMGILEHQLAIVNSISTDVAKSQKDAITAVVDEKSKMELEVMNELVALDDAKRKAEEEWKGKLEKEQLKVVHLRREVGVADENADNDSDDESGSSEEEDEYENEMREGLEELKQAIAEMEDETAKQLDTIDSLKAQLEKLQMAEGSITEETTPVEQPKREGSLGEVDTSDDVQEKDEVFPEEDDESEATTEANGDDTEQQR